MSQENGGRNSPDLLAELLDKALDPQPDELERVLTKEELMTLCVEKKCRVQMNRWNPLHEFYCKLKRRGKVDEKPPHKIEKLLKKIGNHYKNDPTRTFSREQIDKERKWLWEIRKSFNVRWLEWEKYYGSDTASERRESGDSYVTIISQSPKRIVIQSETQAVPTYMDSLNYDASAIVGREEVVVDTENLDITPESESSGSNSLNALEEALSDIVGTQSVSNVCTESDQGCFLFNNNQDESYETFHTSVPTTSTQSQEDVC